MECSNCKSSDPNVVQQYRVNRSGITRLYCRRCKKHTTAMGAPKILLFDIEVSHGVYDLYGLGNQRVNWTDIRGRAYMLGWCAKWLFDDEITSCFVTRKEAIDRNDYRVTKRLHGLLDKADLVIAHNGDKYDIRKLNWFSALHNLQPNNRYLTLDTYKKSRQIFGAESCSLGYLLQQFGYNGKGKMHNEDWKAIERGEVSATVKAVPYCRDDVLGLEDLYLKIRGWMKTHPNMSIYYEMYHPLEEDENYCPRCFETIGAARWNKRYRTPAGNIYKSANCPHCGAILRKVRKSNGELRVK